MDNTENEVKKTLPKNTVNQKNTNNHNDNKNDTRSDYNGQKEMTLSEFIQAFYQIPRYAPMIVIHVGAGYHSPAKEKQYRKLCKKVLQEAMNILCWKDTEININNNKDKIIKTNETNKKRKRKISSENDETDDKKNDYNDFPFYFNDRWAGTAVEAVTHAISLLENDEITNAGFGSNLNLIGQVECDASLMQGNGAFGAVGAVSALKNPIEGARALMEQERQGLMPLGRVPPMMLVGKGAEEWCRHFGNGQVSFLHYNDKNNINNTSSLISDRSYKIYQIYLDKLKDKDGERHQEYFKKNEKEKLTKNHKKENDNNDDDSNNDLELKMDTVGAVAFDSYGQVASGVSSGGIVLKYPGRVGEAAMYGCGLWAQDSTLRHHCYRHQKNYSNKMCNYGCSLTGCGEQIMKGMLAREWGQYLEIHEEEKIKVRERKRREKKKNQNNDNNNIDKVDEKIMKEDDNEEEESLSTYDLLQHFFQEKIVGENTIVNSMQGYYPDQGGGPKIGIIIARIQKEEDEEKKENSDDDEQEINSNKNSRNNNINNNKHSEINNNETSSSATFSSNSTTFRCLREVWYGHTTPSMCIGYAYETREKGEGYGPNLKFKTMISRLSSSSNKMSWQSISENELYKISGEMF